VAASQGRLEAVKTLIEAGGDLDIRAKNGRTALTWAKGNGHMEIVKLLTETGAQTHAHKEDKILKEKSKKVESKGNIQCAFCNKSVEPRMAKDNYCPECDAFYCEVHYPWSDWISVHITSDSDYRSAMCPEGHKKVEYD
jgi:hypothetical protein